MSQPADDINIAEQMHVLRAIREQAQSEFERAQHTIQTALEEADSATITSKQASEAMKQQILAAFGASTEEFRAANACAAKIMSIIQAKVSSTRTPRMVTKVQPIHLYGAAVARGPDDDVWTHRDDAPFEPGSAVAALIDEHSEPNLWILASVVSYDRKRDRYTVVDNEADDVGNRETVKDYIIDSDRVLLLPSDEQVPLTRRVEFQKDETVLAIFPQTTVFYPAVVVSGPKKNKGHYLLQFADDETKQRKVPAHHVVPLPARYYNQSEELAL
ncbi:unnamed protein product (mitochondrion) [Plasmodiophora brassicae]|uniref:SGF29 C-terminal domain-containing protein n=1 Tax=Plasmodiophora brassicae TaxID=37360 RepID=A0A0G4IXL6_PLABS|nr:hypothetical protein PBRA_007799 [Plasmodiophora brassicae]SPR00185.1 unnamed protein product [Plasmodiophora brassicae]